MNILMIFREDRFLRGGDNIPFLAEGWPAARFTEPYENLAHQHQDVRVENGIQYGDLLRFDDFQFIARVAKVKAARMWSISQAPACRESSSSTSPRSPTRPGFVGPTGRTRTWGGYEVVWLRTINPFWTHAIRVGDVREATVDVSKDNVVFGVRPVSHDGHRSPAVFPFPLVIAGVVRAGQRLGCGRAGS